MTTKAWARIVAMTIPMAMGKTDGSNPAPSRMGSISTAAARPKPTNPHSTAKAVRPLILNGPMPSHNLAPANSITAGKAGST